MLIVPMPTILMRGNWAKAKIGRWKVDFAAFVLSFYNNHDHDSSLIHLTLSRLTRNGDRINIGMASKIHHLFRISIRVKFPTSRHELDSLG